MQPAAHGSVVTSAVSANTKSTTPTARNRHTHGRPSAGRYAVQLELSSATDAAKLRAFDIVDPTAGQRNGGGLMSRHEYSIVDWDKKYEVSQAKRVLGPLTWVALPTTHDDLAFRRLMAMDDGAALYGAWIMIVQIAAKCSPRGVLADGRHPLTAADLAMRTGVPEALFSKALQILASKNFGWIKRSRYRASSEHGLSLVGAQCTLQDSTGQHKTKHHTTASGGSRTEGSPGAGQDLGIPIPINLDVPDFLTTWHRWVTYLRQKSIRVSPMTLESQLTQLATIGPVEAIAAIEQSITKGWLSLNPTSHNSPSKGPAPLTEEELTTWRATA